ncbi:response regulator transcription factor [Bacillus sp. DJP31]|uniref:response regulator transcription factor n=1 Tax=Bacillus sp. DJP31 TaxID=3409789 RepID=UPI003BB7DB3C
MSYKILLVDDEPNIIDVCKRYLELEGYEVRTANEGSDALKVWRQEKPDLIVLDIMMPKVDGWKVAETIRLMDDVPLIMLTALGQEKNRLHGLTIGADDYMTKPFSPKELVLRIRNILKRSTQQRNRDSSHDIEIGDLNIHQLNRQVTRKGERIELTVKEFELLWLLANHPLQVFSRSQLLEKIWGYDYEGDMNTVNVHIRRLREKIEIDPSSPLYIKTVWGIGYKLEGSQNEG